MHFAVEKRVSRINCGDRIPDPCLGRPIGHSGTGDPGNSYVTLGTNSARISVVIKGTVDEGTTAHVAAYLDGGATSPDSSNASLDSGKTGLASFPESNSGLDSIVMLCAV
jgi:hypothetical protein